MLVLMSVAQDKRLHSKKMVGLKSYASMTQKLASRLQLSKVDMK